MDEDAKAAKAWMIFPKFVTRKLQTVPEPKSKYYCLWYSALTLA